jgi:hypothetical protein
VLIRGIYLRQVLLALLACAAIAVVAIVLLRRDAKRACLASGMWGEAVSGLRCRLEIRCGETPSDYAFYVYFQNMSNEPFRVEFMAPENKKWPPFFKFSFSQPGTTGFDIEGGATDKRFEREALILPGEVTTKILYFRAMPSAKERWGRDKVQVVAHFTSRQWPKGSGYWSGEISSGSLSGSSGVPAEGRSGSSLE